MSMKARWGTVCAKCDTAIVIGDQLKPLYKRVGFTDGKPVWQRVPKAYVHAPRCPKVTPNRPGQKPPPHVDPQTGEILMPESGVQLTLGGS